MNEPSPLAPDLPPRVLGGVPRNAEAYALSELLKCDHDMILHIAVNDRELDTLRQSLAFFAPDAEILCFPAWDCMPYDRASPIPALMAERMRTMAALVNGRPRGKQRVVLTTANAVIQRLPPKELLRRVTLSLRKGDEFKQDDLVKALIQQGYRRAGKAMEPGEFALRGGIIDIVPPTQERQGGNGVRIDFFGNDIETIKPYDPLTQITSGSLDSIELFPVSEAIVNDESRERFRSRYRETFGAVTKDDPLYEAISQGQSYPGMEHWLPLFYEHMDTLAEYCGTPLITMDNEVQAAMAERWESILDYYRARTEALGVASKKNSFAAGAIYHPLPPEDCFLMEANWEVVAARYPRVMFATFAEAAPAEAGMNLRPTMPFSQGGDVTPFDQLKERVKIAATQGKNTLLACFTNGSCERLSALLSERGFHCVRVERWQDARGVKGSSIGLIVLPLENGFETERTLILSEQDVLGERIARTTRKKKKTEMFMEEAANFAEGELVVHREHGIGRFEGLVTLTVSGASHDCLKLIYADDDKLFLPVENIEMVTRFGLEEENVKLDKLGGASWQARKARLKERITLAAEALLKTAALRQIQTGTVIDTPTGTYDDFCARFPYAETEDQQRAIDEVLEDLHSGRPMDRLICGDVGFGKTEVALRAAFVVACNEDSLPPCGGGLGRGETLNDSDCGSSPPSLPSPTRGEGKLQVALIVPTTLLARQHYRNFSKRFEGFPVTVRQLSRMVNAKEQKETQAMLASGDVDIVIGTHALLAKGVEFKNLGLLIVDEEQHFGVAQKEKLKSLKSNIHVLTLSATPIPRTLQMALTGVRDLSLITTPPVDRLAIRSFVIPFDPVVLREALMREKHRGGKSFVVTPRIKDIADVKAQLASLVPELHVGVAHGQMPPTQLEEVMNHFFDGKFDILLSTAIIESGLDIESANTMIIHNAHLFGLGQLYQMRGRVGRGKVRAYAYFLLPHYRQLSKNATRRLEVMQTLDTLGAGFTLASHDMDIRGFGNLVGEEQSGHIREVGIELYQQMLEEAVAALKAAGDQRSATSEASTDRRPLTATDFSPAINLGLSVLIPETYVDDLPLRLGLYRRVASLASEAEIDSFAAELTDRFGDMPEEVKTLIAVLGIKILCKKAEIGRIDIGPKGAVLTFHNNLFSNPDALFALVAKRPRSLKIRPDQKLLFTHEWKGADDTISTVKRLVGEIAGLAA